MNVATASHRGRSEAQASDRAQAAVFLRELQRQVSLLDEETARLRSMLAYHQRRNRATHVQQLQRELRETAVQRRKILDMVSALSCRFEPE